MSTMTFEQRQKISEGQRARWAERKATHEPIQQQIATLEGARERWNAALPWALAALSLHRDCDPVIAHALERLEAASDAVKLTNVEARELLSDLGEPDPTQPAAQTTSTTPTLGASRLRTTDAAASLLLTSHRKQVPS
jgi:hypothetical protein